MMTVIRRFVKNNPYKNEKIPAQAADGERGGKTYRNPGKDALQLDTSSVWYSGDANPRQGVSQ